MKVGNTINGLTITDVKRVNKLNLIQFLKEVDNYLQKGYQIDVNSARQVGLVLMADVYKTEAAFGGVGSTDVGSVGDSFKEEVVTKSPELTVEAHSDVMLPVVDQNEAKCTLGAIQESTEKLETIDEVLSDLKEGAREGDVVEEATPPVKKTRTKKTT